MTSGRKFLSYGAVAAALILAGGAGASLSARDASVHNQPENRFAAELLLAHNEERSRFGAPRLAWSPRLAGEARDWAQKLAREGRMRHASNDERKGAGENLWMGPAGAYSARTMVEAFAAERRHFKPGTFPHISRTGNWRDVGHFTQVVWHGTREIGCAVAHNGRDDFLVCRYWPAGNTYGQKIG